MTISQINSTESKMTLLSLFATLRKRLKSLTYAFAILETSF